MAPLPRCARHPAAPAGWRCRACGQDLCPGCAATARVGTEAVPACGRCGGFADAITRPRSELTPFPARLARAAGFPFRRGSAIALAACALVLTVLGWFGIPGRALAFGLAWGFYLGVVRESASGAVELSAPEDVELLDAVVLPSLRGALALAIVWVPAAVRAGFIVFGEGRLDAGALLLDPIIWLCLAAGLLYAPAALMHAAFGSLLGMLDPLRVVGTAVRLGRDYLLALAAMAAAAVAGGLATALAGAALGWIPIIGGLASALAGLLGPTWSAHVLGLLLHVRGDAVGLGRPEDYLVPVLGPAEPQGIRPEPKSEAAAAVEGYQRPRVIDLEEAGANATATRTSSSTPIPTSTATSTAIPTPTAAPAPTPESLEITRLTTLGDLQAAVRLFEATQPPPDLAPAVAFAVGRGAYQAGLIEVAAAALHQAGVAGDPAVSPGALLVLGRLYGRQLGRPTEARQALEYLVATWPASDAARHGQAALAALGSP